MEFPRPRRADSRSPVSPHGTNEGSDGCDPPLQGDPRSTWPACAAAEITANPYVLTESFIPKKDHEPISFITIDHGLVPHESMGALGEHRVGKRDPRRLRALLTEVLRDEAKNGHTFIHAQDALAAAERKSPDDRPCDVPLDEARAREGAPTLDEKIDRFELSEQPYLALHSIRDDEARIEAVLDELVSRPPDEKRRSSGRKSPRSTPGTSRRRRSSSPKSSDLPWIGVSVHSA